MSKGFLCFFAKLATVSLAITQHASMANHTGKNKFCEPQAWIVECKCAIKNMTKTGNKTGHFADFLRRGLKKGSF